MIPIYATTLLLAAQRMRETFLWASVMMGGILLGALVIALVNRWRKKPESDFLSPSDQLTQYRMMLDAGTLTKEEFERLRGVLGTKLRGELQVPPKTSATGIQNPPLSFQSDPGPEEPPPPPEGIRPA